VLILSVKLKTQQNKPNLGSQLPFEVRAASALGISVAADALDYVGAPIFALPIVGDIADGIVMALLYRLTGSKKSAAINAIEFIPFVGDFVPTYTITTLMWVLKEIRKRSGESHRHHRQIITSPTTEHNNDNARVIRLERDNDADNDNDYDYGSSSIVYTASNDDNKRESLRTKFMRAYAILRSRAS
jgi:hypothetical protein